MSKVVFYLALLVCLMQSCASSYKPMRPDSLIYNSVITHDEGIEYSTKYELLGLTKNKKYAKKSTKKNIHIVSLKITNNSKAPIYFGKDIELFMGTKLIKPLPVEITFNKLKQRPISHLFYLLLTPLRFYDSGLSTNDYFPIGLIIGPGITGANMALSTSANKKFRNELIKFDLLHREIKVGETVHGLISFPSFGIEPLTLRLKKNLN